MAKRVSDEIDGVDVFTYDTDLLAEAHKLTRPELIDLVRHRKYTGISKFRKADLAIIYADTLTAERDEQRKLAAVNEQMTATLDEIAPLPARTLREEYEGTAARFNPEVIDRLHEQAAAIDEKRTITRAFLSTPYGVVLTWAEIEQGYLDAMAERDRIEHDQAVRAHTEHAAEWTHDLYVTSTWNGDLGTQYRFLGSELVNGETLMWIENPYGGQQRVTRVEFTDRFTARFGEDAAVDEPRGIDTWLTLGDVLIGPQSGDPYRFERWDGDKAVLVGQSGLTMRVQLEDVIDWERAPQASPARIEPYGPGVHVLGTITGRVPVVPLFIHTAGELHRPVADIQPDFTYNLSRLLDDPAHKPGAQLADRDGLDSRVRDFVFATEGAPDLFWDIVRDVTRQLNRARSVTVLLLCRGGKHRSVTFGEELAEHFGVTAKHHHRQLPRVGR